MCTASLREVTVMKTLLKSSAITVFKDSLPVKTTVDFCFIYITIQPSPPPSWAVNLLSQSNFLFLCNWGPGFTQPAQSCQGEIHPLFLVMIAQNWFSHPLRLSVDEIVCFFSLYSVRVDGDQPRGPCSDHSLEKHPGLGLCLGWAAADGISCGFGAVKQFYLHIWFCAGYLMRLAQPFIPYSHMLLTCPTHRYLPSLCTDVWLSFSMQDREVTLSNMLN